MRTRRRLLVALMATVLMVTAACGDDDDDATGDDGGTEQPDDGGTEVATATFTATDAGDGTGYAFEVPSDLTAGATQIHLMNTGSEAHHLQIFKLNPDATMEDVGTQLATGVEANLLKVGAFDGGTGSVDPGGESSADAINELDEGTYAVMCFIPGPNGPHIANGMMTSFEVAAAPGQAVGSPTADGDVGMVDFGFELPDEIGGDDVLNVVNSSTGQPHEMNIVKLGDGATQQDVLDFFTSEEPPSGPPSFSGQGGMQALLPGDSQSLQLDLEPGEYVVLCAIPDFTDPEMTPHIAKGMIATVTVS